jgi:hypothetical protein
MPLEKFEADLAKTVKITVASAEGAKQVIAAARAERQQAKREARAEREALRAGWILALPKMHYDVIYADLQDMV